MQLLSEINIQQSNASIQLLYGDLTAIPPEHAVDILVVSAYPGSYQPIPGTLIDALFQRGLSIEELAQNKAVDLANELGCWLSKPLSKQMQDQFHFGRILCFEPSQHTAAPDQVVGNIFRCINSFAFNEQYNNIAMPVLASGNQKAPLAKMLPAILDAAIFWLENGLPLDCIKLTVHLEEQVQEALPIFNHIKDAYSPSSDEDVIETVTDVRSIQGPPSAPPPVPSDYDFFISYSHKQTEQVKEFVNTLQLKNAGLNIFYDRSIIPPGGSWIRQISEAIQRSKVVICILSPEYSKSDVCWDEFQCAKVMELRKKTSLIKTINFLQDDNMPPMMAIYSYIDCTEGDLQKLRMAVNDLIST